MISANYILSSLRMLTKEFNRIRIYLLCAYKAPQYFHIIPRSFIFLNKVKLIKKKNLESQEKH